MHEAPRIWRSVTRKRWKRERRLANRLRRKYMHPSRWKTLSTFDQCGVLSHLASVGSPHTAGMHWGIAPGVQLRFKVRGAS